MPVKVLPVVCAAFVAFELAVVARSKAVLTALAVAANDVEVDDVESDSCKTPAPEVEPETILLAAIAADALMSALTIAPAVIEVTPESEMPTSPVIATAVGTFDDQPTINLAD